MMTGVTVIIHHHTITDTMDFTIPGITGDTHILTDWVDIGDSDPGESDLVMADITMDTMVVDTMAEDIMVVDIMVVDITVIMTLPEDGQQI